MPQTVTIIIQELPNGKIDVDTAFDPQFEPQSKSPAIAVWRAMMNAIKPKKEEAKAKE